MTLPRQGIKINENIIIDTSDLPQSSICKKPHWHKNIIAVIISILLAMLAVFYLPIRL
ncbi:transcriptional regulator [Salmonella enterica subsp. salamae]|nr:transcriptional regulator [Salmonella enterica subsp. salamae]